MIKVLAFVGSFALVALFAGFNLTAFFVFCAGYAVHAITSGK